MDDLILPPLLRGWDVGDGDPVDLAVDQARQGIDAGLINYAVTRDRLRAALVLAPDTELGRAMAALPAVSLALQNAFGTLGPAELAVQLHWSGDVILNGARCGRIRALAPTLDPHFVPDWLIIGIELARCLPAGVEPGDVPDDTALDQEGCAEIDPLALLSSWAHHGVFWLSDLDTLAGRAGLYRDWQGLVSYPDGAMGVDEDFGLLLGQAGGIATRPLTDLIEEK